MVKTSIENETDVNLNDPNGWIPLHTGRLDIHYEYQNSMKMRNQFSGFLFFTAAAFGELTNSTIS